MLKQNWGGGGGGVLGQKDNYGIFLSGESKM